MNGGSVPEEQMSQVRPVPMITGCQRRGVDRNPGEVQAGVGRIRGESLLRTSGIGISLVVQDGGCQTDIAARGGRVGDFTEVISCLQCSGNTAVVSLGGRARSSPIGNVYLDVPGTGIRSGSTRSVLQVED